MKFFSIYKYIQFINTFFINTIKIQYMLLKWKILFLGVQIQLSTHTYKHLIVKFLQNGGNF